MLLVKIDARRLMTKPENKHEYCTHECKHCGFLLKFPWKVKGSCKSKGVEGGSFHAAHAGRHLEKHYNEAGSNSIKERTLEKNAKNSKHEEDLKAKAENFQVEIGAHTIQNRHNKKYRRN